MPVPDFQSVMLPILSILKNGQELLMRELTSQVADHFQLSDEERRQTVPSGTQTQLVNRVSWAKTHMQRAGLLESPRRAAIKITPLGTKILNEKPDGITCRFLKQFPSYVAFTTPRREGEVAITDGEMFPVLETTVTPKELIETSIQTLYKATVAELRDRLRQCSSGFFEIVVVRLLQALGYGATGEALVTGKSGDGGLDGIIKEDKLGLDLVCVQAKRWEGTVGRPVVQAFVGSMDFVRAKKGVIISTSTFTRDAIDYIERIEGKKVVLIDGEMMGRLMVEYNVGVHVVNTYSIKEVSNDFFDEDEG